jgi:hypothetical protein
MQDTGAPTPPVVLRAISLPSAVVAPSRAAL